MDEHRIILSVNYYQDQKTRYSVGNMIDHILVEASIMAVRWNAGYEVVHNCSLNYQNNIERDLDFELGKMLSKYNAKKVYVYGFNQIIFRLSSLRDSEKLLEIFDLRKLTHTDDLNAIININTPYKTHRLNYFSQYNSEAIKDKQQSIINLCRLLSKNLILGYSYYEKAMYFNTNHQHLTITFKNRNAQSFTPTHVLNDINRTFLLLLKRIQIYMEKDEQLVEFILQLLLLHLIKPNNVDWKWNNDTEEVCVNASSHTVNHKIKFELSQSTILMEPQILNIQLSDYVKKCIKDFSETIKNMKRKPVDHSNTNLLGNIKAFIRVYNLFNY